MIFTKALVSEVIVSLTIAIGHGEITSQTSTYSSSYKSRSRVICTDTFVACSGIPKEFRGAISIEVLDLRKRIIRRKPKCRILTLWKIIFIC